MQHASNETQLTSFRGVHFSSVLGAQASSPLFSAEEASLGANAADDTKAGIGGTIGGTVFTCAGLRPPFLAALLVLAEVLEPFPACVLPAPSLGRCWDGASVDEGFAWTGASLLRAAWRGSWLCLLFSTTVAGLIPESFPTTSLGFGCCLTISAQGDFRGGGMGAGSTICRSKQSVIPKYTLAKTQ